MRNDTGDINMILIIRILFGLAVLCICWTAQGMADETADELAAKLYQAYEHSAPMPNLSKEYPMNMSLAYEVQKSFVKSILQKEKIAGFKAGLTSDEAQAEFNINRPIIGVLFKKGHRTNESTFILKNFNGLMIEAELGYIVKRRIHKKVNSIEELKRYISQVIPVVELPDVAFESTLKEAVDLVSVNTGSAYYMPEHKANLIGEDVNGITVTMSHNNNVILQGQGKDALGDQWEALRWLVNQILAHGWVIEKDYLLITGALGGMTEARPGQYKVQYNNGSVLTFQVTD